MGYRGECPMSKIELEALALTPAMRIVSWAPDGVYDDTSCHRAFEL